VRQLNVRESAYEAAIAWAMDASNLKKVARTSVQALDHL